jgi:hypothetical protein
LVSIKYIWSFLARFDAFEIRICADIGHRRQNLGKAPPAGAGKRSGKDFSVFRLCTASMPAGPFLQRPYNLFIDTANQQVGHLMLRIRLNDKIDINDINLIRMSRSGAPRRRLFTPRQAI